MAVIKCDDTTAGRTYVAKITRDSDGYMWDGVDDFVAENTLTDAQQATAVGLSTTTPVVSGSGTHSHYIFTTPAGITVPCHIGLYLTSYAVGTKEAYGADYDPTDAAIKAKTDLIPASPAAVGSAMTLADGVHGGSNSVLTLKNVVVNNPAGTAIDIDGTTVGVDIQASNTSSGVAINIYGGYEGIAVASFGAYSLSVKNGAEIYSTDNAAVSISAMGSSRSLSVFGGSGLFLGASGDVVTILSSGANGDGIQITPNGTGKAINAVGAIYATANQIPWNAGWDAEVESECSDALNTYDPPTNAEMILRTLAAAEYATAASQGTIAGYIDTEIGDIKAVTDVIMAALSAIHAKTTNLPDSPAAVGSEMTLAAEAIDAAALAADAVAAIQAGLATAAALLAVATEVAKVPRSGQTYRWTNAESAASVDLTVGEAD